jgi:glycosyltransferase involved in cell wall biosynthesis
MSSVSDLGVRTAVGEPDGGLTRPGDEGVRDAAPVELTILMPCLNEAETLATCINKARAFLAQHGIAGEVLIADNGSTDGSQDLARSCGARVVDVPIRGYGAALYHGSLAARGTYVIMGDSDDSYDFSDLMNFVEKLRAGYDLVMGNRFQGGIKPGAMPWKNRWLGNPVLSTIGRMFFHCPVGDFHCGLRGYSVQAFRTMDLHTTGMEFASEMVIKATLLKLRIAEVPTTLSPDGRSRPPHLRPWRDGWRHLRFMLLYSPRWLFFYPGLLLMVVGLVIGLWLLPGARHIGSVGLDVHTLLYSAFAVIIGFQGVLFAVCARVLATVKRLLPPDRLIEKLCRAISLETGLVVGASLFVLGLGGSLAALLLWEKLSFGPLEPTQTMRVIIPAGLGMCLGSQMILASFFLSFIRMGREQT